MRRFLILLVTVAGVVVGLAAIVVIYAASADLAPLVEKYSQTLLGRSVRLASLHLDLGRALHFEARDVRLPSDVDPKLPDLAKIERFDTSIRLFPLFIGRLVIQSVTIDGSAVTLVRNTDGTGNWATSRTSPDKKQAASKRTTLPPLLDATVRNAEISYIGTSGSSFPTHIDTLRLRTPGPANPVELEVDGAMDQVPLIFKASLQSFDDLQNLTKPFRGKLTLSSGRNTLTYQGTATDPLNFNGLDGKVELSAPALSDLANEFGAGMPADLALSLAGNLKAWNDNWHFRDVEGKLRDATFKGSVEYAGGARGDPDTLASTVRFDTLDVGSIMGQTGSGDSSGSTKLPNISAHPGVLFDTQIDAQSVTYHGFTLNDLRTHLVTRPGQAKLEQARFNFAGGTVSALATADSVTGGLHLSGSATVEDVNTAQASRAAGSASPSMDGPVSAQMQFDLTGATLSDALGHGRIVGAAAMPSGTVSRKLVRMAKANIRALWTDAGATTQLRCMLAAIDIHDGSGVAHPVQVATPIGTLAAWGQVNVQQRTLDMTLQSQGQTTDGLALDVPIHITGPLTDPAFQPSPDVLEEQSRPQGSGSWPKEIEAVLQGSACRP